MRIEDFAIELTRLPGAAPVWHARVTAAEWRRACQQARAQGGRLVALWGSDRREQGHGLCVDVALVIRSGLIWLTQTAHDNVYAGVADIFPAAERMQRAIRRPSERFRRGVKLGRRGPYLLNHDLRREPSLSRTYEVVGISRRSAAGCS